MFFCVSLCTVGLREDPYNRDTDSLRLGHYAAAIADVVLGIALLTISLLAIQFNFLPNSLTFAMIGAGSTYAFGMCCAVATVIKFAVAPDKHLIK